MFLQIPSGSRALDLRDKDKVLAVNWKGKTNQK